MIKLVAAIALLLLSEVAMPLSKTMDVNNWQPAMGLNEHKTMEHSAGETAILAMKIPVSQPVQMPQEASSSPVRGKRLCRVAVR